MGEIINRVKRSGLITIDLADYFPEEIKVIDLKDNLWQGLALKEKDFRTFLSEHDWTQYQNQLVSVCCTVDAIIPTWAFMLVITYLKPVTNYAFVGSQEETLSYYYTKVIQGFDNEEYEDTRIVVKGCGEKPVPLSAYGEMMNKFQPITKSLMFGEPCSTVPLYKKKRNVV